MGRSALICKAPAFLGAVATGSKRAVENLGRTVGQFTPMIAGESREARVARPWLSASAVRPPGHPGLKSGEKTGVAK